MELTEEEEGEVCPVCLDPFKDPRFLPCHHTLCTACIQDLANRHPGKPFPCPSCRKPTILPRKGVRELQSNYYLKSKPKGKAAKKDSSAVCQVHEERLKYYCMDCEEKVCSDCRLTTHKDHKAQGIQETIDQTKKELPDHHARLKTTLATLKLRVKSKKEKRQWVLDRVKDVESSIKDRHATLVLEADKLRDSALNRLHVVSDSITNDLDTGLKEHDDRLTTLVHTQEQLDDAAKGTDMDILALSKTLKSGACSQGALDKLTSQASLAFDYPSLSTNRGHDVAVDKMRHFLGTVTQTSSKTWKHEMTTVKTFKCSDEPNTKVFSLSLGHHSPRSGFRPAHLCVYVSYEQYGDDTNAPAKAFDEDGRFAGNLEDGSGKASIRCWEDRVRNKIKACGVVCLLAEDRAVFNKTSYFNYFKFRQFESFHHERYLLFASAILCTEEPSTHSRNFLIMISPQNVSIKVCMIRAFDSNYMYHYCSIYVVVEEPLGTEGRRRVVMYTHTNWERFTGIFSSIKRTPKDPICTYNPPNPHSFQPSDVCFFQLRGARVLLIADESSDLIHVAKVKGLPIISNPALVFDRYLATDCPLLRQPTALNKDDHERLWVACKEGNIVALKETTTSKIMGELRNIVYWVGLVLLFLLLMLAGLLLFVIISNNIR